MSYDLIKNALEYYDENRLLYNDVFKNARYIKLPDPREPEDNTIHFYNKNTELLFSSRYEIIGIYNNTYNTWAWGWSLPMFYKNKTSIAKKMLNYGIELEPHENIFLKTILINSRFRMISKIQYDVHAAIASYLSKQPLVYNNVYYQGIEQDERGLIDLQKTSAYPITNCLVLLDYEQFGLS